MSNMRQTIWVSKSVSSVPSSAADDLPHSGNDAFLGSLSTFMPGLIGRYIDDDGDQHVVPYDWGTPVLDDGLFEEDARGYDYRQRLDKAYTQATLNSGEGLLASQILSLNPFQSLIRRAKASSGRLMLSPMTFQRNRLRSMGFQVSPSVSRTSASAETSTLATIPS